MTPQSLKEELLKEFDEKWNSEREVKTEPPFFFKKGNFKSFLSSAIDKAYAAGREKGREQVDNGL